MATTQLTAAYDCPRCPGTVTFEAQSWQCEDCGFAPKHSAD